MIRKLCYCYPAPIGGEKRNDNMINITTPELEKVIRFRDESQIISGFLDFLSLEQGICFCRATDSMETPMVVISESKEQLLAAYFGINLDRAEKERRTILEKVKDKIHKNT